jgi:hypothetical protein
LIHGKARHTPSLACFLVSRLIKQMKKEFVDFEKSCPAQDDIGVFEDFYFLSEEIFNKNKISYQKFPYKREVTILGVP